MSRLSGKHSPDLYIKILIPTVMDSVRIANNQDLEQ